VLIITIVSSGRDTEHINRLESAARKSRHNIISSNWTVKIPISSKCEALALTGPRPAILVLGI
jgi:hypothetical protein